MRDNMAQSIIHHTLVTLLLTLASLCKRVYSLAFNRLIMIHGSLTIRVFEKRGIVRKQVSKVVNINYIGDVGNDATCFA